MAGEGVGPQAKLTASGSLKIYEPFDPEDVKKKNRSSIQSKIWLAFKFFLLLGWFVFLIFAFLHKKTPTVWGLFGFTIFCIALFIFKHYAWLRVRPSLHTVKKKLDRVFLKHPWPTKLCLLALLLALFLVLLIIVMEVRTNPTKLIPVAGFFFLVFLMWACSVHPFRVNWRPVIAGFTFQILLAIFVLKTKPGRYLFLWLGRAFQRFVSFADKGSTTVYGFLAERHIFYFSALPVVIFCSSVVSTLYHFGAIQWFCKNVTVLFRFIIGTSSHETLTAFANIMLSMTEAPLLVRPYLPTLTRSELFCIMTSGFATSSVSLLGAYNQQGAPFYHLITSFFMACPASLAVSKLLYPETEDQSKDQEKLTAEDEEKEKKCINFIEAAAKGAVDAAPVILNIAAVMIAFVSLIALVNFFLRSAGDLVGVPGFSLQKIFQYLLYPFCVIVGIPPEHCLTVAALLGLKLTGNELIALEELAQNRQSSSLISEKSFILAIYALCSFANLGSMGIQLGFFSCFAPQKVSFVSKNLLKAMLAGQLVNMLNVALVSMMFNDALLFGL